MRELLFLFLLSATPQKSVQTTVEWTLEDLQKKPSVETPCELGSLCKGQFVYNAESNTCFCVFEVCYTSESQMKDHLEKGHPYMSCYELPPDVQASSSFKILQQRPIPSEPIKE